VILATVFPQIKARAFITYILLLIVAAAADKSLVSVVVVRLFEN